MFKTTSKYIDYQTIDEATTTTYGIQERKTKNQNISGKGAFPYPALEVCPIEPAWIFGSWQTRRKSSLLSYRDLHLLVALPAMADILVAAKLHRAVYAQAFTSKAKTL